MKKESPATEKDSTEELDNNVAFLTAMQKSQDCKEHDVSTAGCDACRLREQFGLACQSLKAESMDYDTWQAKLLHIAEKASAEEVKRVTDLAHQYSDTRDAATLRKKDALGTSAPETVDQAKIEGADTMAAGEERVVQWSAVGVLMSDFVAEAFSELPEGRRKEDMTCALAGVARMENQPGK